MSADARELGIDGTINELKRIMASRFQMARSMDSILAEDPIFSAGVGLSSLEGAELLTVVESHFGVKLDGVEEWFDEPPTLGSFAQQLIDQTR